MTDLRYHIYSEIPIWDEFARKPAKGCAPSVLVPEIDYVFSPETAQSIVSGWGTACSGQLGGGFRSDQPFRSSPRKVPLGARAPKWVKCDGSWCLSFDGTNDYVNLPREVFPQAAFTLEMEVKPDIGDAQNMVLFRHYGRVRGSLSLFVRKGCLFATWGDKDLSREPEFDTGLAIRDGEWNSISVSYDFEKFAFRVGGNVREFPWRGRAYSFMPSIFGGHDSAELSGGREKPAWFRGLLRRLTIRHRVYRCL